MTTASLLRGTAVCSILLSATVSAQGLMLRDGIVMEEHMTAFDSARLRLVEVGRHGETRELDGSSWLVRPGSGPRMWGGLAYRQAARRMFAFGMSYGQVAETWEHDGVGWQRLAPAVQPSARQRFAIAYDSIRDRVVVFSGFGSSGFADTWEWDGVSWLQRATSGPAGRQDSSMAFDSRRGRCVLFGGESQNVGMQGDTWEWDGVTWTQRVIANGPSPRTGPALAYDLTRGRIVMHGGLTGTGVSDQVWEYDGVTWQLAGTGGGPLARYRHDLVFDAGRNEVLAVGGQEPGTGRSDIHSWNGTRWQLVVPVGIQPGGGFGERAAAEPVLGGLLMYIGSTWRFAGGNWTLLAPASVPPVRFQVSMWSDGARAWFFGGFNNLAGVFGDDLWSWNGTDWQPSFQSVKPARRSRASVAFDSTRGRAVLFGGSGASIFGDTWTFDGIAWQQQSPPAAPPARYAHGMAFDPGRARIVLFGGTGAGATRLRDTWEWNGGNWAPVATAVQPPAYGAAAMAYDGRIGRSVMTHAPATGSIVPSPIEAWTFDGAAWAPLPLLESRVVAHEHSLVAIAGSNHLFVVDGGSAQELVHREPRVEAVGAACDPSAPRLGARSWPEPGNAEFGVDVVAAPSLSVFALGGSLTTGSTPIGPCTLLLAAPPVIIVLGVTSSAGFATHRIPVPLQQGLVGMQCFFQAAVLQPAAPVAITLSAALRVTVGE